MCSSRFVQYAKRLKTFATGTLEKRRVGETTAFRPLSDLTIQGFIVHSWYKHSHQVCVEVKMGQRCQQITHTLHCYKHHTLKRHSKCIVSVTETTLCTCIINFGPLLQFQVNSFTHGEIMTRFYATLTMEQYFIMARSYVTRHSNETSPAELLRSTFH